MPEETAQNDQPLDPALLDRLWDVDDPAGSEQRLRDEIEARDSSSLAARELTTQLVRAVGLQGRYDEASALLDGVDSSHPLVLIRVYLERGRLRHAAGDQGQAMQAFATALGHAMMVGHGDLALDAIHMLSIVDPGNARTWVRQGLDIIAMSPEPSTQRWREILTREIEER